ncbi:MAG: cytochrome P450 [Actinobacteria bacterium]|nr:cytochrome P450 [Actinomycetota bacterium]
MKTTTRWVLQHGVVRLAAKRAVRQGDLHAHFMREPRYRDDPFPFYEQVRSRGELVPGRLVNVTASYDVVSQVLRSDDWRAGPDEDALPRPLAGLVRWSRDARALGPIDPPSMLVVEPPDHTRYRRLVSKVFTARAVEALRPDIEAVASDLLDRLAGRDDVDVVASYANLLPVAVISQILGVPPADHERVLRLGHLAAPSLDVGLSYREFRVVDGAVRDFQAWLTGHIDRLRREPGQDLLSQLVRLEDEGQRLSEVELKATAGLLLAAGFETTVNLLGSGIALLLGHPDELAAVRDDPALWPGAVDETLRMEGPVQMTGRFAVRETALAGQSLKAGSLVVTYLGGANRDPAVFADPHRFDVRRANVRDHLTFSAGRHFCVGAALARLEGEIGLRALFDRYPDLALRDGGQRRTTRVLRGWQCLPVRLGQPAADRVTAAT